MGSPASKERHVMAGPLRDDQAEVRSREGGVLLMEYMASVKRDDTGLAGVFCLSSTLGHIYATGRWSSIGQKELTGAVLRLSSWRTEE